MLELRFWILSWDFADCVAISSGGSVEGRGNGVRRKEGSVGTYMAVEENLV
jgi:hypothetical protein